MELSALKFAADTTELERASTVIAGLVTDVGKLTKANRDAAQIETLLAKANKANADANLQNAKAQDVRLKSTITADKADKEAEKVLEKKTKATNRQTESMSRAEVMLKKTRDAVGFMTDGLSRGQASQAAYLKSLGGTNDQIEEFIKLKQLERKLIGKDTFDDSQQGLLKMKNAYSELKESVRQYNTDSALTSKQARELARDKERIIESMKAQGASFQDIRKAVRAHNDEFVKLAGQYNKLSSAEDAVVKSRKEAVNATNYLTKADEKMSAALNVSNAALDKGGTDSLVKYETALRKSGVSQDVATQRLAKYKIQLEQVRKAEAERAEQFLTRAIAPQASDVVVSLWSGQNPLTVLLQQGAQVNDVFMQSGVAAERFGEVVKKSMASMLPSILVVAKGVGGLVVDGFVSAGKAANDFLARSVGVSGALDAAWNKASENGPSQYAGRIAKLSTGLTLFASVSVAAAVVALGAFAVALVQVTKEHNELVKSLNLTGASLGLSADGVVKFAQSIQGVKTTEAISFIQELSKTGAKASTDLAGLTKVAVDLEKYGGVALKDTAKAYDDLQSKPFEGLMKLAEGTGQVSQETVDLAVKLKLAGDEVGLLKLANDQFIAANGKAVDSIKAEINPMTALWITVKDGISFAWEGLKNFARTGVVLDTFIASLRVIATGALAIGAIFRGLGKTIALAFSVYAQTASAMNPFSDTTKEQAVKNIQGVFAAYKDDMSDWKKGTDAAFNDIWNKTEKTTGLTDAARAANSTYAASSVKGLGDLEKAYNSIEKAELKKITRQQAINKAIEDYTQKNKQASQYQLDIITQGAGIAWDKAQKKPKKDPSENYYATLMREATNNTIAATNAAEELTKSELKLLEVKADPRFVSLNALQKQDIANKYEAAIAAEKQAKATDDVSKAEAFRDKILGKSKGITREYYGQIKALEEHAVKAGWSREQIEELTRAIFQGTPAWQQYQKALDDVNRSADKFNEMSIGSQAESAQYNKELNYRVDMLGKTSEQQKAITIEYQRANKLREVDIKLSKQLKDINDEINKAKLKGLKPEDYKSLTDAQVQAERDAAEERKGINREVAVQAAEDFDAEFRKIKEGVTDSIVTALFEGGKAGSKKLRDVLVNVLRQKVTMVVDVGVNAVLNSLLGGTGTASGGGGLLGTLMQGTQLYSGLTSGSGALGSIGTALGLGSSVGVGAGAGATAVNGLSALTPVTIGTNSAAVTSVAAGAGSGGIMGSIGAAAPYIGLALAAVSLLKGMDKSGTPHMGAGAIYSSSGGLQTGSSIYNKPTFGMGVAEEYNAKTQEGVSTLAKSLVQTFDGIATTFGKTAGYEIATAFAADNVDGAWGSLRISQDAKDILNWASNPKRDGIPKEFSSGEAGYTEYLAAIAKDTRQVLLDMDIPSWANTILESVGDSGTIEQLSAAVGEIAKIQSAFVQIGSLFDNFAGMTDKVFEAVLRASGGIEVLSANLTGYYNNFYTEGERTAKATENLGKEFAKLGITLPEINESTREWYRSEVERLGAMDLSIESNAKAYTSVLGLQQAVNELAPAFDTTKEEINTFLAGILSTTSDLEIELLVAQGKQSEATAARRAIETKSFSAAEIAAYDYNARLRESITATNAASAALKAYKTAATSIATSKDTIAGVVRSPVEVAQNSLNKSLSDLNNLLKPANIVKEDYTYLSQYKDVFDAFVLETVKGAALAGMSEQDYADMHYKSSGKTEGRMSPQELLDLVTTLTPNFNPLTLEDVLGLDVSNQGTYSEEQWGAIAEVFAAKANLVNAGNTPTGTTTTQPDTTVVTTATLDLAKVLQDYNRALLEAQGNTSGLEAFDKAISDAALITEGWTQLQIDAVDAAREVTKVANATKEFNRALLEAQGDTAGLAAFDKAISDAALLTQGWTQSQIDLVDAAREFTKVSSATKDFNRALLEAQGDTSGLAAFDKAITDAALLTQGWTQSQINAVDAARELKKALDDSIVNSDSALSNVQKALEDERTLRTKAVDAVKEIFTTISDAIKSIYNEVDTTRSMQVSEGRTFIANAATLAKTNGVLPKRDDLVNAIEAVRSDSTQYATKFESDFASLVFAGQLQELKDIAEPQLTEAEALLAKTNDAYEVAKSQLDALRGIDSKVLSVSEAIEAFQVALTGEQTTRQKIASSIKQSLTAGRDQATADRDPANIAATKNWAASRIDNLVQYASAGGNIDISAVAREVAALQQHIAFGETQNLPSFDSGINYIPHDMIAKVHEGETIVPKKYNPFNPNAQISASSNDPSLIQELKLLRTEVQMLRIEARAAAISTAKLNNNFERSIVPSDNGDALLVKTTT